MLKKSYHWLFFEGGFWLFFLYRSLTRKTPITININNVSNERDNICVTVGINNVQIQWEDTFETILHPTIFMM